jgi:hypothetical protein
MSYVSTLLLHSLRLIGEKQRGDTLTSNEQTECLAELNLMLDSWGTQKSFAYHTVQESHALSSSVGSYTIGSGGTINTTRPTRIVDPCFIRDSSNYDSPVQIIDKDSYGKIVVKGTDGSYPTYLYYDPGFPLGTIYVYPEPQAGLTLYFNSWKQLGSVSTISAQVSLPPGYETAIVFNYAIFAAGGYQSVSPEVAKIAKDSLAAIKSLNLQEPYMRLDAGIVSPYVGSRSSILTG